MTDPRIDAYRMNLAWWDNQLSRPATAVDHLDATRDDAEHEPEPTPVSVKDMSPEEYAAFRQQMGIGQSKSEGRGIFDGVSSRSEAYHAAANKQSGRTAWVGSNVEEAPRIARVTIPEVNESRLDARPLAERFGNASNAFSYGG